MSVSSLFYLRLPRCACVCVHVRVHVLSEDRLSDLRHGAVRDARQMFVLASVSTDTPRFRPGHTCTHVHARARRVFYYFVAVHGRWKRLNAEASASVVSAAASAPSTASSAELKHHLFFYYFIYFSLLLFIFLPLALRSLNN